MGLNQTLLTWTQRQLRNRVWGKYSKRAECWDLAEEALRNSGGRTSNDMMGSDFSSDADYVWGTPTTLALLEAGDIIQFRLYRYDGNDGEYQSRGDSTAPQHTAIVAKVGESGAVEVFEQNVPRGKGVVRNTLYFQSGGGITVTGSWWFYRPQTKT